MSKGFIYILTNPSFPQYVKIGYATDVKQRLDELNRSTAIPFAFRVYATYEVDSTLSDKKLHSILDISFPFGPPLSIDLLAINYTIISRRKKPYHMNNRQVCYDLFFVYLHLFELKRCGYWEGVFI